MRRDDVTPRGRASEEDIRRRAYEIFLRRGGTPGDPVVDWVQAERELDAEHGRSMRS